MTDKQWHFISETLIVLTIIIESYLSGWWFVLTLGIISFGLLNFAEWKSSHNQKK